MTDKVGLREAILALLANHHHLPTTEDIKNVFDKTPTDVHDSATTTKLIIAAVLAHFEGTRPEKKEEELHAGYEFSLTGREFNQAIDKWDKDFKETLL